MDSGLSPTSVQRVHALLHKALKQAVHDGLVPRTVTEAVKALRQFRKEIPTLTREQVCIFLSSAKGDRREALYLLAMHTGLRQGELLGLKWGEIDLDRRILQVRCIGDVSPPRSWRIPLGGEPHETSRHLQGVMRPLGVPEQVHKVGPLFGLYGEV